MTQRHANAARERDELRVRFEDTVREAQQKSGFRTLLLERKLGGLAEEVEKRDACVKEVKPPPPPQIKKSNTAVRSNNNISSRLSSRERVGEDNFRGNKQEYAARHIV